MELAPNGDLQVLYIQYQESYQNQISKQQYFHRTVNMGNGV